MTAPKKTTTPTTHSNIYTALAVAQTQMEPALKRGKNPHFRSDYAELADVVAAVQPALNANGIAYFHIAGTIEGDHHMTTVLHHGESETCIECQVPLIVSKNDMQGYKSACTYAKRIGLESVTGVAPEDDDGNAAAKAAPPKAQPKPKAKPKNAPSKPAKLIELESLCKEAEMDGAKVRECLKLNGLLPDDRIWSDITEMEADHIVKNFGGFKEVYTAFIKPDTQENIKGI